MPSCGGKRIRQMILRGELVANTEMTEIPYVGEYISAIMQESRIRTIRHFVRYFENRSAQERYARITVLLQNRRGNQCSEDRYHIQDVNRCAYTKLRNLLIQARNFWRRMGFNAMPRYPPNPIPVHPRRTQNAKRCSCIENRRACNGTDGCEAIRVGNRYVCIPSGRAVGFGGVGDLTGQMSRDEPNAGGYPYVQRNGRYHRRPTGATRARRNLNQV